MVKLQLAIDDLKMQEAIKLTSDVKAYVDIIEMGTPFLMKHGINAVTEFKKMFPEKEILADLKIMDGGFLEAQLAFEAGADYVTVLGATDILTIDECQKAAIQYGRLVYVDMICVKDVPQRIVEIERIGIFGISVHTGVDQQSYGRTPIDDLHDIVSYRKSSNISVAGGINSETVGLYVEAGADVVIVGGAIYHAENPVIEARLIYEVLNRGNANEN